MKNIEDSIDIIEARLRVIRAISDLLLSIGDCNLDQDTLPELGMLFLEQVKDIKQHISEIHSLISKEETND